MNYNIYDRNSTIFKYNPKWYAKSNMYKVNQLAFEGEWALKMSDVIKTVLMPTDCMDDPNNPKGDYLWDRYKQSAIYTNYPAKYLKQAKGLATKEKYQLSLPKSMESLDDYATTENTTLQDVYVEVLDSIIKYGTALIITKIPDEVDLATTTPKMEVIEGCNVLDGEFYFDSEKNVNVYKRIVYYKREYIFNPNANTYTKPQLYVYVKALDQNGKYYEAKMKEEYYGKFNLFDPMQSSNFVESISYPEWYGQINFVPCVFANKDNLKLEWKESPIQNLIDVSIAIFQLTADTRFLMHQQSSATLVIAGTDMEGKSVRTGLGNVLNLTDSGSNAAWISPAVAGLQSMLNALEDYHTLAKNDLLTFTDAGASSSGDSLALRVQDKTRELIGIVSMVGKAVQRELELIAELMGEDPDEVVFTPYIGFGSVTITKEEIDQTQGDTTEDTVLTNENEEVTDNDKQETETSKTDE